jgi:hypothetical protein
LKTNGGDKKRRQKTPRSVPSMKEMQPRELGGENFWRRRRPAKKLIWNVQPRSSRNDERQKRKQGKEHCHSRQAALKVVEPAAPVNSELLATLAQREAEEKKKEAERAEREQKREEERKLRREQAEKERQEAEARRASRGSRTPSSNPGTPTGSPAPADRARRVFDVTEDSPLPPTGPCP